MKSWFKIFLMISLVSVNMSFVAVFVSIDPKLGDVVPVLFGISWVLIIVAGVYAVYHFSRNTSSK